jgi:TolB protein
MVRAVRHTPNRVIGPRVGVPAALLVLCAIGYAGAQARRPYAAIGYGGNYLHNYLIPPAPSATPFAPTWSPDGREVAFSLHGSIWITSADGGEAREVVSGSKYYSSPAWSPDGRWIAYTADDGGKSIELEIVSLQTGETRSLTSGGGAHLDPVFSPDGSRLAYAASQPNGYLNVFVRPIQDGAWAGEAVAITDDSTTEISLERPYFTAQDMHTAPAWIGNDELLIVSNHGVALGSGAIVRVPVEPLGIRKARVVLDEQTLYHARPVVSPDRTKVAYVSADAGRQPRHQLVVRPLAGGPPRRVTSESLDVFRPRWSPDGRRLACVSNRSGVPELSVIDARSGHVRPLGVTSLRYLTARARLSVTVRDPAGAMVPARVHVTASDGKSYAPTGAYARLSWAGDRVFHTKGTFELEVPPGPTRLLVVRGFELEPATLELDVAATGLRRVDVRLKRIDDITARGWHVGSTGAHMQAAGLMLESLPSLVAMAEAEAVSIVSNPVAHRPHDAASRQFWSASEGPHPASSGAVQLVLGQEHRPPFFGHVMAFGSKELLSTLSPVTIGYEAPPGSSLGRTNTDTLRDMRRAGGITSYVHAFSGENDPMQAGLGIGKAFPVDTALDLVDTLEWAAASRGAFVPWYAALNNGLRVAAIGGEDSITNLHISRLVGCVRTYVFLGKEPLTPTAWWRAAKAGRSFVTTGPLVELQVNGQLPGGEIVLPPQGGPVTVSARVRSIVPLQRVQLVMNGQPVQDVSLDASRKAADWSGEVKVNRSGWIHLRAEGTPAERAPLDALYAQAFTNPVWLKVGDRPVRDRNAAEYSLQWIDRLQIMAEAWPGWTSSDERAHVFGQLDEARRVYRRFAQEAGEPASTQGDSR